MDPFTASLIIGGVSAGVNALSGANKANAQKAANQKAINKSHKGAVEQWQYGWDETQRGYDHLQEGIQIRRRNEKTNRRYQDKENKARYADEIALRDFQFGNKMREFVMSESIFGSQVALNDIAAREAVRLEDQKFNEITKSMAFEQTDAYVELLQSQGMASAKGQAGSSLQAQLGSNLAQFGRNQARMEEELVSAQVNRQGQIRNIGSDYMQAMLQAHGNRMLMPLRGPNPSKPRKLPKAVFQDPLKPTKPPKPRKGVNTVPGATLMSGVSDAVQGFQSGYNIASGIANDYKGN
jgi:hypothetical protein